MVHARIAKALTELPTEVEAPAVEGDECTAHPCHDVHITSPLWCTTWWGNVLMVCLCLSAHGSPVLCSVRRAVCPRS